MTNALAGGTGDALTVPLLPCGLATNLLILTSPGANTTSSPTLQMIGFSAMPVVNASGGAVPVGALPAAGGVVLLSGTGTKWLLLATGATANGGIFAFTSLGALQSVGAAAASFPTAQTNGYYASGDGGAGTYIWNAGDTTASDCFHIQVSGVATGRYELQTFGKPIDLPQCGAHGDGATDDTVVINSASASAFTKGVEIDEAGAGARNYLFSAPLNWTGQTQGFGFHGAGIGLTQFTFSFSNGNSLPCVDLTGTSYSHVTDLTINSGTSTANSCKTVELLGAMVGPLGAYGQSVQNVWERVSRAGYYKHGIYHCGDEAWTDRDGILESFALVSNGDDITFTANGSQTCDQTSPFQTQEATIASASDYSWEGGSSLLLSKQAILVNFNYAGGGGEIDNVHVGRDVGNTGVSGTQALFGSNAAGGSGTFLNNLNFDGEVEADGSGCPGSCTGATFLVSDLGAGKGPLFQYGVNINGSLRSATSSPTLTAVAIKMSDVKNCFINYNPSGAGGTFTGAHLYTIDGQGACQSTWTPKETRTVATLPTCNAVAFGETWLVSDADSPTWNGTLTGGGTGAAANVTALCNGTNWVAGGSP